jgi:glycosyltransferase involved in cell wall biosynthesis
MTLTLSLTTYNRYEMLKRAFEQVIDVDMIDDIVILDDHSDIETFRLIDSLHDLSPKVKVTRQAQRRGMSKNKHDAIALAKNEWVLIGDSDNVFTPSYLAALSTIELFPEIIYMPDFAIPEFDFRKYDGLLFDRNNIKQFIKDPPFSALMNCCNYVVHRDSYLKVYQENESIDAADTIWFALNWLKAGNKFFVVPGMTYTHTVHNGSGFLANVDKNMQDAERIKRLILEL